MVYFKFQFNKCFVKPQASNQVILKGILDESGLYCFPNIALEHSRATLSHKSYKISPIVNVTLGTTLDNSCQSSNKKCIL